MVAATSPPSPTDGASRAPARGAALTGGVLLALLLALHAPGLSGPIEDGQAGNCAAMFALMAHNAQERGLAATRAVPVLNPAPPADDDRLVPYTHHPPGLPWLVMAASRLPMTLPAAERLAALALFAWSTLLLASLGRQLAGPRAGLAAGLAWVLLPSGVLHGTLVNYETIAVPPMVGLTTALLVTRRRTVAWAATAAACDWVAVSPAVLCAPLAGLRSVLPALGVASLVGIGVFLHGRSLDAGTTGETLAQALAATFLGPDFDVGAFGRAALRDGGTLLGLAGPLALAAFAVAGGIGRRVLTVLLGTGVLNVVLFAHHASSHEHFWLLLAPFTALGVGLLAFPRPGRRHGLGALVFGLLLAAGWAFATDEPGGRGGTRQSTRAEAFAEVADPLAVHVTPPGVPLVFLAGSRRLVVPFPVGDEQAAREAARAYGARFARGARPAWLFLHEGDPEPPWLADLGPADHRGPYRFWPLDD